MAREQRRDVDYFPHPCRHGRKMHIIEQKYGNDGYAVWFKILEQLGAANNHFIDVSEEMNFMYLVSIFRVEESTAKSILNDLAKLGAIDKFLYEKHQVIFSDKFLDSVKDAYRKRTSKAPEYSDVLELLDIKTDQSGGRNPQTGGSTAEVGRKGKKSKVKERKGERNAGEESPLPSTSFELLKLEKSEELNTFKMQHKKQVKKWQDLVDNFNDKMEIEISQGKTEFKSQQLMPRLRTYTRAWISNQEKYNPKEDKNSTSKIPIG